MELKNTYQDSRRAAAYDELELGGTYDLVFRNLPGLYEQHVQGSRALDFGCGTGRSTRFTASRSGTVRPTWCWNRWIFWRAWRRWYQDPD